MRGMAVSLLERALRAEGVPIQSLHVDRTYELHAREPDKRVAERSWGMHGDRWHQCEFTAPLFRWRFKDGRGFQGRPEVSLRRREWKAILAGGETYEEDGLAMLSDLGQMIRRSWKNGAD